MFSNRLQNLSLLHIWSPVSKLSISETQIAENSQHHCYVYHLPKLDIC